MFGAIEFENALHFTNMMQIHLVFVVSISHNHNENSCLICLHYVLPCKWCLVVGVLYE